MAATTTKTKFRGNSINSFSIIVISLIIATFLFQSTMASQRRQVLAATAARRSNRPRIPRCSEMASNSQCSQNPNCKWCRSEVLDDMCFTKSESLRLPSQVFSCDS